MEPSLTNLNLLSEENYMKQDISSGSTTIQLGVTTPDVTTYQVNHGPKSIKFYQVDSELDQTSTVWIPDIINANSNSSAFFTPVHPIIDHWMELSTLTIRVDNSTSANTGNLIIYWLVYLDYGLIS